MEAPADDLQRYARSLGRAGFIKRYAGVLFLVRRDDIAAASPLPEESRGPDSARYTYHTTTTEIPRAHQPAWERIAAPIVKREGNPFPDRMSVGRAPNCDIVVRLPHVSKLHAHFTFGPDGRLSVSDNDSTYGTRLNGKRIDARTAHVVKVGDILQLGYQSVELRDAVRAYQALVVPSVAPAHMA